MTTRVKRAYRYRFYPTDAQAAELSRTFGCVRKVYNVALAARTQAWMLRQERVDYNASEGKPTPAKMAVPLTVSTGETITNPRHERRDRARPARAQRELSRKATGDGANRAKARRKVARVHALIADRRRDHPHKLTTRLVRENQTIVIEDLTIPSSKLCSVCGSSQDTMPLNVRTWRCECGTTHDRDVNAAKNLLAAGPAVSACGAGVRPQQESSRIGHSATKQETPRREP